MKLKNCINELDIKLVNHASLENEIADIYIGDLLSFVMANGKECALWLTVQKHVNVVAVAELNDFAGIVFIQGVIPDDETIEKANEYHIPLLISPLDAYSLTKEFMKLGI